GDGGSRLSDHAQWALNPLVEELGPPSEVLATVLTVVAAAAPGICALRAVTRISEDSDALYDPAVGHHALRAALVMRYLVNRPALMAIVRGATDDSSDDVASSRWQVLRYCFDGTLQAVLDEYSHTLSPELKGLSTAERAYSLA